MRDSKQKDWLEEQLQIDDTIKVVLLRMQRLFFKNYTYLVVDQKSKAAILVDPAWEMKKIEHAIELYEVKLKAVIITHTHQDHTHLAWKSSKLFKCPVYCPKKDTEGDERKYVGWKLFEKESSFTCGSIDVLPIFTPGHTKGSCCYIIGENIFTGDTLFTEGCGMCFGSSGNPFDMYYSLQRLKTLPHRIRVFPGHSYGKKPGLTLGTLIKENIYLNFSDVDAFVAFRMRKNQRNLFRFRW